MSVDFYNNAYLDYPPYEDTPMRHMYEYVARQIPRLSPVVDLGCGNGYLASALRDRDYGGHYNGYDLSPVAVEMAQACFQNRQLTIPFFENNGIPQYQFEVVDLREWEPEVNSGTHKTVFTCFEVLEHVEEEEIILSLVPARARFLFSVPNYWSRSHVRTYDTVGTAFDRYGKYLTFNAWRSFPTKQPEACIHLYDTIRRKDKW